MEPRGGTRNDEQAGRHDHTLIICATIAFLGAVAGVVFLVSKSGDATPLGLLVVTPVIGLLALLMRRLGAVEARVNDVHSATVPAAPPIDEKV